MTDLAFEVVRGAARFAALAPAWSTLWSNADGSVFQSHGWISAWWDRLAGPSGSAPAIVLAWRDGDLAGAAPFAIRRHRGIRVLEWAAKDVSDYCDVLVAPDLDPHAFTRRLWRETVRAGGFDLAYLSHVLPDAAARVLIADHERTGAPLGRSRRAATSLRVRREGASADGWFDSLSKKTRQNYRRGQKALAEFGAPGFRLVEPGQNLDPILDRLVALKRDWLAGTGETSSLLDGGAAPLKALVAALAETGRLRVFVVESEGRIVAGSVNFVEHGRMMAFFATYDPDYERASPGMTIMVDYTRWAFGRGIGEIDFLCGAEEYKRRFANAAVELAAGVAPVTLSGHAALAIERGLEGWRGWRDGRSARRAARPGADLAAADR